MRAVIAALLAVLLVLQYTWWFGRGGAQDVAHLKEQIADQQAENTTLEARNSGLLAEVMDLKQGMDAIEEVARSEMGMVRKGEIFFQLIEPAQPALEAPAPRDGH